jgi:hypothetical protein
LAPIVPDHRHTRSVKILIFRERRTTDDASHAIVTLRREIKRKNKPMKCGLCWSICDTCFCWSKETLCPRSQVLTFQSNHRDLFFAIAEKCRWLIALLLQRWRNGFLLTAVDLESFESGMNCKLIPLVECDFANCICKDLYFRMKFKILYWMNCIVMLIIALFDWTTSHLRFHCSYFSWSFRQHYRFHVHSLGSSSEQKGISALWCNRVNPPSSFPL